MGVVALGPQGGQGHVDAFHLAGPASGLCAGAASGEVGFEFVEPGEHLGIDVRHRAADADSTEMILNGAAGHPSPGSWLRVTAGMIRF